MFLFYVKYDGNFAQNKIAIVKSPRWLFAYGAPVVSRNLKI